MSENRSPYARPWAPVSFAWILFVIVFVYWLLVVVGLVVAAPRANELSFLALSLGLLLG